MLPITTEQKMSPWMFAHTRPIEPGMYECRFRDLAVSLMLRWDGACFWFGDKRMQMATLVSWRGQWAM